MQRLLATSLILFLLLRAAAQGEPDAAGVQPLLDSAWAAYDIQDFEKMKIWAVRALELAEQQKQEDQKAESHRVIGRAEEELENREDAFRNYSLALSFWEQQGDERKIAGLAQDIAILKDAEGDYELSRNSARRAVKIFEAMQDSLALANALVDLANPNKSLGDYNQALMCFLKADSLFRHIQDTVGMAISSYGIGDTYYQLREYGKARPFIAKTVPVFKREKEPGKVAMAYNVLAGIDEAEGQREKAKRNYLRSSEWAEKAGDSLLIFDAMLNLAEMEANDGRPERARELLAIAEAALGEKGSVLDIASLGRVAASLDALEKEMENRRLYQLLAIFLACLAGLGTFAFWQYRKRKGHALVLHQQLIEHQREVNMLLDEIQLSSETARVEGEKRERKKITKTLHDTVGSQLAATRWLQEANIEALKNGTLNQEGMQNVLNMMSEAYKNARNVERLLDKDSIDWLEEVGVFFQALAEKSRLKVDYVARGLEDKLDWELGLSVYKIALTLTANVLLHARASHLSAEVSRAGGVLSIVIKDDGVGFDRNRIKEGSGLKNVEEYVKLYEGTISVEPNQDKGAVITISIPMAKPEPRFKLT